MTGTFQQQLLNYITGKLDLQSGNNQPSFLATTSMQNNLYTYISNNAVQPQTSTYKLIKGKSSNGADTDEHLLYGIDEYDNSSFIVILDVMLNPIQFINSYASGTKFGAFEELIIDDDGRFYGVEYVNSTSTRRFVMLNNILATTANQSAYKVVLRQSYNLPSSLQTGTINKLIKKPLANRYLFCATTTSNYPILEELTINVGAPNEWVEYTYTTNNCSINGAWASWDNNDNLSFKLACIYTSGNTGYLYIFNNTANSITLENQFNLPEPTASWIQTVVLNENTIYLGCCYVNGSGIYKQYIYKVTNAINQIFASPNTFVGQPVSLMKSDLYTDGYNVFVSFNVPNTNNTIDYYMGIIYNDNVYYNNFGNLTYTTSQRLYATNTFHQFNLYTYYLQLGDVAYNAVSIFNNLNYNGVAYSDINGLVPNSVVLSNNNGYPLFARNLYNKIVNDNVTVSTVEIPNTLMNYDLGSSYEISQQQLYSQTNQELVNNYLDIDKNIYETVDINFYNTLSMRNNNDPNNSILNLNGAVKVNKGISNETGYYEVQATKVKINYSNGSNFIVAVDPATQITITNDVATYSFIIYAPTDRQITSIEIISYDETTSYATITGTFTQGKYYRITQDVYIE